MIELINKFPDKIEFEVDYIVYTYDNFKFIWPLPQLELDANPTLRAQQNPGY